MKKLIPTKFFFSFKGIDKSHREVSYGNGTIDAKDMIDDYIIEICLKKAKIANSEVVYINLITFTPLEFDIIE